MLSSATPFIVVFFLCRTNDFQYPCRIQFRTTLSSLEWKWSWTTRTRLGAEVFERGLFVHEHLNS